MEYRFMGSTGLKVSELCLGTMTFGREADEVAAHEMLDAFTEAGGSLIDTADTYSFGRSEEIVGSWLKGKQRDDLVIATKVYGEMRQGGPVQGVGRKHIMSAVDASLRRLGTDYLDLYQVHVFDDATPLDETLSTLDALVTSGKVRFIGASNYTGWQLQKAIDRSRQQGWEPYTCLQPLYNLIDRDAECELIPVCLGEGAGLIAWSPLAGGWLTGKYRRGMSSAPAGTRAAADGDGAWAEHDNERTWRIIETVVGIAGEVDRTPAQVALRWLVQQPAVTAAIVGARSIRQLRDNLGASGWSLSDDQARRLTEASERPLPYPYALQRLPQFLRRASTQAPW
jgi:aryl-alcohol dehydrogenase-like predicted oxidoreductase